MSEHRPNVVINCAALSRPSPVILGAVELWRQEIEVNLIGSYYVASSATLAGALIMIFLASIAGLYGKPNHSGYSASKAGVISLVQSLAHEGHHAYAISPGRVDSKMREREYPNEDKETRLQPIEIGWVVRDIIDGRYRPGDNIIIRRIGHRTAPNRG